MNTTNPRGLIIIPGCEIQRTTRDHTADTLHAYAFLREPVTCRIDGTTFNSLEVPRPRGLDEAQSAIACNLLCHATRMLLGKFLPGIAIAVIDCDGAMIEIADGWTMAPSIEIEIGYRRAIRWHAYSPDGNPIIENKPEHEVAAAIVAAITAHHVATHYRAA